MKILMLSDPNSPHTIKWATSLSKKGIKIILFGLGDLRTDIYSKYDIEVWTIKAKITRNLGSLSKVRYLRSLPLIKKLIKRYKPDILHAHYASSYGLIGALTNFHPFVVSAWGGDVFDFPKKSIVHKKTLEFILKKADKILATSNVLAKETNLYTDKSVEVTPFGIDINVFKPMKVESVFNKNDIVIGTIKALEEKYGIEYLIKAFKILVDKYPDKPLKLLIVGGGSLEDAMRELIKNLNITTKTVMTGKIPYEEIPKYHNMLSIYVALSILDSESFGVAILEAQACEKPVVVSKVGGLPEVAENGVTGFIVPPKNPDAAAKAIEKLILDETLRANMGKAGRKRVEKLYSWDKCVEQMIEIYEEITAKKKYYSEH